MTVSISYVRLLGCIVLCEGAGIVAGILTAQSVRTWYPMLHKPWFTPPGWVFGPTWTLLYLLMGISLYIVWTNREVDKGKRTALFIFFIQLTLNPLWSFVFFGLRSLLGGFIEIVALWIFILLTMVFFWRLSRAAAYLLVPYFFWSTFAAVLNFSIWSLNRPTV